nr:hypothetical protein [Streptomyces griseorubiginosus]
MMTNWATVENSRRRRRRVLRRIVQGQIAQAGGPCGADAVFGTGPSAVPQFQFGERGVLGVGGEAGELPEAGRPAAQDAEIPHALRGGPQERALCVITRTGL